MTQDSTIRQRPRRPLGLSLAIIASALLFSILPLLQVGFVGLIQSRFAALGSTEVTYPDGQTVTPLASGVEVEIVNPTALIIQVVVSLVFLTIAVMTWVGRPRQIRYIFLAAVLTLAGLSIMTLIIQVLNPPTLQTTGLSSGDDVGQRLRWSEILVSVLVPLYVVWYVNRAPARAFFRGYYLEDERTSQQPS